MLSAPDRTGKIVKFNFDAYAIIEASPAQGILSSSSVGYWTNKPFSRSQYNRTKFSRTKFNDALQEQCLPRNQSDPSPRGLLYPPLLPGQAAGSARHWDPSRCQHLWDRLRVTVHKSFFGYKSQILLTLCIYILQSKCAWHLFF